MGENKNGPNYFTISRLGLLLIFLTCVCFAVAMGNIAFLYRPGPGGGIEIRPAAREISGRDCLQWIAEIRQRLDSLAEAGNTHCPTDNAAAETEQRIPVQASE